MARQRIYRLARGAWDSATSYQAGQYVLHPSGVYRASANVTTTEPPAAPWVEIPEIDWPDKWSFLDDDWSEYQQDLAIATLQAGGPPSGGGGGVGGGVPYVAEALTITTDNQIPDLTSKVADNTYPMLIIRGQTIAIPEVAGITYDPSRPAGSHFTYDADAMKRDLRRGDRVEAVYALDSGRFVQTVKVTANNTLEPLEYPASRAVLFVNGSRNPVGITAGTALVGSNITWNPLLTGYQLYRFDDCHVVADIAAGAWNDRRLTVSATNVLDAWTVDDQNPASLTNAPALLTVNGHTSVVGLTPGVTWLANNQIGWDSNDTNYDIHRRDRVILSYQA